MWVYQGSYQQNDGVNPDNKRMKIPLSFYVVFWLKNSVLALATGFIIIYLIPPLFAIFLFSPSFGLIGLVIYQIFIIRYFKGDYQGDFEYAYSEAIIEKVIRKALIKKYGSLVFLKYLIDQTSQIRFFEEDLISSFSQGKPESGDEDLEFAIDMKLAEFSQKDEKYEKEREYLIKAFGKKPLNLIAHFRLAVSFEGAGMGTDAIENYKIALQDPRGISDQLQKFIKRQISLVEANGPRRRPPIPGLRFITW